jgi:hypothetical protein
MVIGDVVHRRDDREALDRVDDPRVQAGNSEVVVDDQDVEL